MKDKNKIKSEAQKRAIRAYYAKKNKLVSVNIKTHRDKKGGHPHVILDNIDKNHVSVGLSTKPTKGKGSKNYKLEVNPLGNGVNSYMRRQGTVAPVNDYFGNLKGVMTPKDYTQAKVYGERAKQKYIDKKNKKKSNDSANAVKHKPDLK